MSFKVPEEYRQPHPVFKIPGSGNNGFFVFKRDELWFKCLSSDGGDWEHVSISTNKKRCPTWEQMCMIKDMFWDEDDCVIQFHPPKKDNISMADYCLHLWRPIGQDFPKPLSILVGFKYGGMT